MKKGKANMIKKEIDWRGITVSTNTFDRCYKTEHYWLCTVEIRHENIGDEQVSEFTGVSAIDAIKFATRNIEAEVQQFRETYKI